VEVYLSTDLSTCEQRDRKGLYKKARSGSLPNFTGISDPYEPPLEKEAELVLDTSKISVHEAAVFILEHLQQRGYLPAAQRIDKAPMDASKPISSN